MQFGLFIQQQEETRNIDINKKINTNLIYALILTAMIVMW